MDKVEPPSIPDGYGISIAYACLLDIIRSISLLVATETEGTSQLFDYKWCLKFKCKVSNIRILWSFKYNIVFNNLS